MLKSIQLINLIDKELHLNLKLSKIKNYYIELRINQIIDLFIVSDEVETINDLTLNKISAEEFSRYKIKVSFLSEKESKSDDYCFLFEGEKVSFGLRRSLSTLLEKNNNVPTKSSQIISFFSYKGGVGRTTSLALTATYLARKGMNVFVLDCDFEAPGLVNFFDISQINTPKNGLIEYLNDTQFCDENILDDYIYNIDKRYAGDGTINLMPAGNVLGSEEDLSNYLEGLAKLDLQGNSLVKTLALTLNEIDEKFSPDIILIDSRTGFNNVFGALACLSTHLVVLAGDDIQNIPGLEYISKLVNQENISASFILSILSSNFSRRFNNFSSQIKNIINSEDEFIETFYFDRQNTLEFVGTPLGDPYDLDDFINGENGSPQYHKFFSHIENIIQSEDSLEVNDTIISDSLKSYSEGKEDLKNLKDENNAHVDENVSQDSNKKVKASKKSASSEITNKVDAQKKEKLNLNDHLLQDTILEKLEKKLPDLYAENISHSEEYLNNDFFFRPCMEDFLIPEKCLLLGDKGTGKTAFYSALQNQNFFKALISKSQKSHLNYLAFNITNFDNGYDSDNFEVLGFDEKLKDELFFKRFWLFFIWNAIYSRCGDLNIESSIKNELIDLKKYDQVGNIIKLVENDDKFNKIERDLEVLNQSLKSSDKRLIITFDRLDNIVKPSLWNDVISPLIKLAVRFPFSHIYPKLFLRRDLYGRLGNLTNKNSFHTKTISLEWSQNEIFSFFLKIIFNSSYDTFFEYLSKNKVNSSGFSINIEDIKKKLRHKQKQHNQLPLDTYTIMPIINAFFGAPRPKKNGAKSTAYEDLYRNIQSADKTVNLRPFIDLITYAIKEQKEQDSAKSFRKEAILGLAYCTSKSVRKQAVVKYLEDLWDEQGNEFVKYFCQDFAKGRIPKECRKNWLDELQFEKVLQAIKENNKDIESIKSGTIEDFKRILIANKIMNPYMVGNKNRYGVAYLYTNYLGV